MRATHALENIFGARMISEEEYLSEHPSSQVLNLLDNQIVVLDFTSDELSDLAQHRIHPENYISITQYIGHFRKDITKNGYVYPNISVGDLYVNICRYSSHDIAVKSFEEFDPEFMALAPYPYSYTKVNDDDRILITKDLHGDEERVWLQIYHIEGDTVVDLKFIMYTDITDYLIVEEVRAFCAEMGIYYLPIL